MSDASGAPAAPAGPAGSLPPPMVRLPSGVVLRVENINFITRAELNKYGAFFGSMGNAAILTGEDIDVLEEFNIVQRLVSARPKDDAPAAAPKVIATA